MIKLNKKNSTTFVVTFALTLLVGTALFCMMLSLTRMNETLYGNDYVILKVVKVSENVYDVTALNTVYTVDLSILTSIKTTFNEIGGTLPITFRSFYYSVLSLFDITEDYLAKMLL